MQVADAGKPQGWIGVDRGQNILAVASVPSGMPKFWRSAHIRKIRKHYAVKRRRLQKVKKMQVIKRLEQKERRTIKHINHVINKEIVQLAVDFKCNIRSNTTVVDNWVIDLGGVCSDKTRQSPGGAAANKTNPE